MLDSELDIAFVRPLSHTITGVCRDLFLLAVYDTDL